MRFDGFPGEKTILSYKLVNGVGWLTTHRLIIQQEKHNPRLNIMERQDPEMYLLRDFEKAEIKGETLTAHFRRSQKATMRLQFYSPALLQEQLPMQELAVENTTEKETKEASTQIAELLLVKSKKKKKNEEQMV